MTKHPLSKSRPIVVRSNLVSGIAVSFEPKTVKQPLDRFRANRCMRPETHYDRSVTLSAVIGSRLDCNSALSAFSMISNSILLNSCFSTIILLTLTQRHDRNRNGRLQSRIALRGPVLSCPRSAVCASESDLRASSAPPIPGLEIG